MQDIETWEIKDHVLEYIDESHTYLCDGVVIPSITQIMKIVNGNKYKDIPPEILKSAADKGTEMHLAIELYEKEGKEDNIPELKNYKFLKKHYKWEVLESEIPILLFHNGVVIAAGRLDQVIKIEDKKGINDLKRTAVFDKPSIALQTNLYRIGYQQSYDETIDFVSGTHLRDNTRKFSKLPVNQEYAEEIIEIYLKKKEEKDE